MHNLCSSNSAICPISENRRRLMQYTHKDTCNNQTLTNPTTPLGTLTQKTPPQNTLAGNSWITSHLRVMSIVLGLLNNLTLFSSLSASKLRKRTHFYWDLLIEPEFWFTYAQPYYKHINIGRTDMHVGLFHGNTLSNQIHNIQITNKMHFNVYDVFYSLNSHQYVQGDTSIIIRIQRYKCCVVLLTLHHN